MLVTSRIFTFLFLSMNLQAMGHFIDQDLVPTYFNSQSLLKAYQLIALRDSNANAKLQSELRILTSDELQKQYSFDLLSAEIYAHLGQNSDELTKAKIFEDKFMLVLSKLEKVRNHLKPSQIKWLEYLEINGLPITNANDPRIDNIIPFQ